MMKQNEQLAYEKGKLEGEASASRKITIRLVNVYYNSNYKWWELGRRNSAIKSYIDSLWSVYGPQEVGDDEYD